MSWASRGVDVSSHQQPSDVPWAVLRASGVEFAFLRSGMGLGRDAALLEHARRARDGGVDVLGAYHALYPRRPVRQQADLLAAAVAAIGPVAPILDLEVMNDRTPGEVADAALEFVEEVERLTGRRCVVYTYPYFALSLPLHESLAARELWIAHYKAQQPLVPRPWTRWRVWQHDGDGGLVAPNGLDLDFDVCRLPLADLRALLVPRAPTPAEEAIGALARSVRAAEGHGATAEEFVSRDEGPVVR